MKRLLPQSPSELESPGSRILLSGDILAGTIHVIAPDVADPLDLFLEAPPLIETLNPAESSQDAIYQKKLQYDPSLQLTEEDPASEQEDDLSLGDLGRSGLSDRPFAELEIRSSAFDYHWGSHISMDSTSLMLNLVVHRSEILASFAGSPRYDLQWADGRWRHNYCFV